MGKGSMVARMLAWLLAFWRGGPQPDEQKLTRVHCKRKGFTVHVADAQTGDTFCLRAANVHEAKRFMGTLIVGAMHNPEMPAREVAEAARDAVNEYLVQCP